MEVRYRGRYHMCPQTSATESHQGGDDQDEPRHDVCGARFHGSAPQEQCAVQLQEGLHYSTEAEYVNGGRFAVRTRSKSSRHALQTAYAQSPKPSTLRPNGHVRVCPTTA